MKDRIIRTILTPILVVTLMWGSVCGKASACNGSNDDPSLVEPLTLEQEYVRLQSHRKLIEQAEADGYALSSEERAELLSTAG